MAYQFNPFTGNFDNVGSGGTPASPTGSIQFNSSGAFGGSTNFTWDGTSEKISGSANAVSFSGAATGHFPKIATSGSDTEVTLWIQSQAGTATHSAVLISNLDPTTYAAGVLNTTAAVLETVADSVLNTPDWVNTGFGDTPIFYGRRANGTVAAPMGALLGDTLFAFNGTAWTAGGWRGAGDFELYATANSGASAIAGAWRLFLDDGTNGFPAIKVFDLGTTGGTFNSTITATDFLWSGTKTANFFLAGPTSGAAAIPTYRAIVVADIPSLSSLYATPSNAMAFSNKTGNISQWTNDSSYTTLAAVAAVGYATATSATAFSNKTGNISQWTNDSGYITTVGASTGTGNLVRATSPTLVTPLLGTPTSGTLTNCTGLPEAGLSLTDITTANVSATAHGFAPKFPNNTTTFLRGDGTYAVPPGTSSGTVSSIATTSPISGGTITTTGTISLLTNVDFAFTNTQTITPAANTTGLIVTGGSITGSGTTPFMTLSGTWNTTGLPTAFKINITDTASNNSTLLLDLQRNGGSVCSVGKFGGLLAGSYKDARFQTDQAGQVTIVATVGLNFPVTGAALNTVLFGDATGTLGLRNAANPQRFRIYNTFTTVTTVGEWWKQDWITTANQFRFGTVMGTSTGTARAASWDYGGLEASPTAAITVPITSGPIAFGGSLAFGANLAISNAVPTISSGFGSGATIAGITGGFRITCGTVPGTGGTVAFNTTYANIPVCFVQDETTGVLGVAAPTTTTVVISGLTLVAGQTIAVLVFGY